MSDEDVEIKFGGNIGDLTASFDKIKQTSGTSLAVIEKGAALAAAKLAMMGESAKLSGSSMSSALTASGAVADQLRSKLASVETQYAKLQSSAAQFQAGQGSSLFGALGNIGGAFATGGLLGAGALTAGFVAGQVQMYATLGAAAEKARVSAAELQGLQSVFKGLGVSTDQATALITAFAANLQKAATSGGEFADLLRDSGVAITDESGKLRSTITILGEFARSLKDSGDKEGQLQAATLAVGQELAGTLVGAVDKSITGLSDVQAASLQLAGVFTTDLASAARIAADSIAGVGTAADGAYAQLRRLAGFKDALTQLKAAQQDLTDAQNAAQRSLRLNSDAHLEGSASSLNAIKVVTAAYEHLKAVNPDFSHEGLLRG